MLVYKKGDILEATENMICHQVNIDGVMGGGLALQIAKRYPCVENKYRQYCKRNGNSYKKLAGRCFVVSINDSQEILNCFTQKSNFDTDYEAILSCFETLLMICKSKNKTICIPYRYGSGIANGDWNLIKDIFERLSKKYDVNISIYIKEERKDD